MFHFSQILALLTRGEWRFYFPFYLLPNLYFARLLIKVEDNFRLKLELKWFVVVTCMIVLSYLILIAVPGLCDAGLQGVSPIAIFYQESEVFGVAYFCLFDIWRVSLNVNTKMEKSDSLDVTMRKNAGFLQEIESIITNPEKNAAFSEFLCKEFCIEELMFLESVYKFKKEVGDNKWVRCLETYRSFIEDDCQVPVNLPGPMRADIVSAAFSEFLCQEFCIEEFLLLELVYKFKKEVGDNK